MMVITHGTTLEAAAIMLKTVVSVVAGSMHVRCVCCSYTAMNGGEIAEAVNHATADVVLIGRIFAFVSAGVNAVKAAVRYLNNTTKIYRAISVEELESLKQTKMFSVKEGAFEGKQFGLKLREIKSYANLNFNDGVYSHIVKTRIPNSVLNSFTKTTTDAFVFKSGVITVTSEQLKILNRTMFYIKYIKL